MASLNVTVVMIYVAVKSNIKQTSGLFKDAFSSFPALGVSSVRHSTPEVMPKCGLPPNLLR